MPSRAERAFGLALLCLTAAACAGSDRPRRGAGGVYRPVSDTPVRIGPPYTIRGITYTPREDRGYDEIGIASWYGSESGNRTANGERFRPEYITAAHKTLPLPTYVEVTALDTGRTILVRINDRGPFVAGRIIDLSRGSAEALGVLRAGAARVRVRRVDPPERDRAALRAGRMASARTMVPPRAARPWQSSVPSTVPARLPLPTASPRPAPQGEARISSPPPPGPVGPRLRLDLPPPEPETMTPNADPDAPAWAPQPGSDPQNEAIIP
jgi:rare lipoprotein A